MLRGESHVVQTRVSAAPRDFVLTHVPPKDAPTHGGGYRSDVISLIRYSKSLTLSESKCAELMKFYDCKSAPSPRRARIFIAEKKLQIETVEIDLGAGEQFSDSFRKLNPRCTVPVLELDNGTTITENIGIATYLEAANPEPSLLGTTAEEKGMIASWNARMEFEGLIPTSEAFRNRTKGLRNNAITGPRSYAQIPELAERGLERAREFLSTLDERLSVSEYIGGEMFSVADITALCVVDFAAWVKVVINKEMVHLKRWHDAVSSRPSAKI